MWLNRLTEALSEDPYIQASQRSHYQMLAKAILNNQPEWIEAQRLVAVYEQRCRWLISFGVLPARSPCIPSTCRS